MREYRPACSPLGRFPVRAGLPIPDFGHLHQPFCGGGCLRLLWFALAYQEIVIVIEFHRRHSGILFIQLP